MATEKKRATAEQLEVLLLELERRPEMQQRHWEELSCRLNAMGVSKTAAKWQQAWRDFKSNTKKKAAKLAEDKSKYGERHSSQLPLTDLEVRVSNMMGTKLSDAKPHEIDITKIPELDPLSSEDSDERRSDSDEKALVFEPDAATVYSVEDVQVKTEEGSSRKRKSNDSRRKKIKRHRIDFRTFLNTERIYKESNSILERLTSIEEVRRQSDEKTASLLERLTSALDRFTSATLKWSAIVENNTTVLNRLADAWENRS